MNTFDPYSRPLSEWKIVGPRVMFHGGEQRDWIQGRRIDYVKVGTRVMIRPETIRQFVTSNTRRAAG